MSKKWRKLTDVFNARSDDGRIFRIYIFTTMIDARSWSDPNAPPVEEMKEARTSDGYPCNQIDENTWEIVQLGIKVQRI